MVENRIPLALSMECEIPGSILASRIPRLMNQSYGPSGILAGDSVPYKTIIWVFNIGIMKPWKIYLCSCRDFMYVFPKKNFDMWVCLKMSCTPKPNGFADHYPYEKWLFHWEHTLFSDKPI